MGVILLSLLLASVLLPRLLRSLQCLALLGQKISRLGQRSRLPDRSRVGFLASLGQ